MKKLFGFVTVAILFALSACSFASSNSTEQGDTASSSANSSSTESAKDAEIRELYDLYADAMHEKGNVPLTYDEWLASIRGEPGEQGPKGDKGEDGTSLLTGRGAPSQTTGAVGDSYIDTETWDFYLRVNSGWVKQGNIKGEPGKEGPQGPKGDQGEQGNPGIQGPIGETGQAGSNGKSTYELYCEAHPEYTGTEAEWIEAIAQAIERTNHRWKVTLDYVYSKEEQYVLNGAKAVCPSDPIHNGLEFDGWYTEPTGERWNFEAYPITEDITLYAKWHGTTTSDIFTYSPTGFKKAVINGIKEGVTNLTIPSSLDGFEVESISEEALWPLYKTLKTLTIPDEVKFATNQKPTYPFEVLETVFLGNRTLRLGGFYEDSTQGSLFRDCATLKSVTVTSNIASIGVSAFANCRSLASLTMPETVTWVGAKAFYRCSSLKSLHLPNATYVGKFALYGCNALTDLVIPEDVYTPDSIHGPEDSEPTSWCLVGDGGAFTESWTFSGGIQLFTSPSSKTDKAVAFSVFFDGNEKFKVSDGMTWFGYEMVDQSTGDEDPNAGIFSFEGVDDGYGGKDISCKAPGLYDFYIRNDDKIVIKYSNSKASIDTIEQDDYVNLVATVGAISSKGFVITDKTGSIYVYLDAKAEGLSIGDFVNVQGLTEEYHGYIRISKNVLYTKIGRSALPLGPIALTKEIVDGFPNSNSLSENKLYSWVTTVGRAGAYKTYPIADSSVTIEPIHASSQASLGLEGQQYQVNCYFVGYDKTYDFATVILQSITPISKFGYDYGLKVGEGENAEVKPLSLNTGAWTDRVEYMLTGVQLTAGTKIEIVVGDATASVLPVRGDCPVQLENGAIKEDGEYSFYYCETNTANPQEVGLWIDKKLDLVIDDEDHRSPFYLVGSMNDWTNCVHDYAFVKQEEKLNGKDLYKLTVALPANCEFKVRDGHATGYGGYYPIGNPGNIEVNEAKEYTILFCPEGDESLAHSNVIGIEGEVAPDTLYIRGTAIGDFTWGVSDSYKLGTPAQEDQLGVIKGVNLVVGDFKISNSTWAADKTYGCLTEGVFSIMGSAKDNFEAGTSDKNIHCKVAATYDIYLMKNGFIYIEHNGGGSPADPGDEQVGYDYGLKVGEGETAEVKPFSLNAGATGKVEYMLTNVQLTAGTKIEVVVGDATAAILPVRAGCADLLEGGAVKAAGTYDFYYCESNTESPEEVGLWINKQIPADAIDTGDNIKDYYLVCGPNHWTNCVHDYAFVKQEEKLNGKDLYKLTVVLPAGAEFRVRDGHATGNDGYFPALGANVTVSETKEYTILFCPDGDESLAHDNVIGIESEEPVDPVSSGVFVVIGRGDVWFPQAMSPIADLPEYSIANLELKEGDEFKIKFSDTDWRGYDQLKLGTFAAANFEESAAYIHDGETEAKSDGNIKAKADMTVTIYAKVEADTLGDYVGKSIWIDGVLDGTP